MLVYISCCWTAITYDERVLPSARLLKISRLSDAHVQKRHPIDVGVAVIGEGSMVLKGYGGTWLSEAAQGCTTLSDTLV